MAEKAKRAAKETNLRHRAVYVGDNLPVLRCTDGESVDLVYMDPPFNTGRGFPFRRDRQKGDKDADMAFEDTWKLADIHWDEEVALAEQYPSALAVIDALSEVNGDAWRAYLIYMGVRLAEIRRILNPTGGVYYHCDPAMSHGVKLLMDAIFGRKNFRNEIVWWYSWGVHTDKYWNKKHDIILYYAKDAKKVFFDGKRARVPYREGSVMTQDPKWNKKYCAEGKLPEDVFDIPTINSMSKERTGYPTQKPLALLKRIIAASGNKGDFVLDPFCGCGTSCLSAEWLERRWAGIDVGKKAADLVVKRLLKESDAMFIPSAEEVELFRKSPKRTDLAGLRTANEILRPRLYKMQGGVCEGCETKVEIRFMDFDHIIAEARGGQDIDGNIQLLCRQCNGIKGARGMTYLRKRIAERRKNEAMTKWREERRQKARRG